MSQPSKADTNTAIPVFRRPLKSVLGGTCAVSRTTPFSFVRIAGMSHRAELIPGFGVYKIGS